MLHDRSTHTVPAMHFIIYDPGWEVYGDEPYPSIYLGRDYWDVICSPKLFLSHMPSGRWPVLASIRTSGLKSAEVNLTPEQTFQAAKLRTLLCVLHTLWMTVSAAQRLCGCNLRCSSWIATSLKKGINKHTPRNKKKWGEKQKTTSINQRLWTEKAREPCLPLPCL